MRPIWDDVIRSRICGDFARRAAGNVGDVDFAVFFRAIVECDATIVVGPVGRSGLAVQKCKLRGFGAVAIRQPDLL